MGVTRIILMDRSVPFERILQGLLLFFPTRQIFCGAGKVGVEREDRAPIYQLSQRAEFFEVIASVDYDAQASGCEYAR